LQRFLNVGEEGVAFLPSDLLHAQTVVAQ
jgi:hypothetical protein